MKILGILIAFSLTLFANKNILEKQEKKYVSYGKDAIYSLHSERPVYTYCIYGQVFAKAGCCESSPVQVLNSDGLPMSCEEAKQYEVK